MSFGFSVGDFLATAKLISDIISSLQVSSVSEYRELIIELHNLKRALDDIEHLKYGPEQSAAATAVKVAALTCRFPLDEFASKIRKFQCLQEDGKLSTRQRVELWRKKLEWGLTMKEEEQRLRTYLTAHVGSLNLRLTTLGLTTQTTMSKAVAEKHNILADGFAATHSALQDIRKDVDLQKSLIVDTKSQLDSLFSVVSSSLIPVLSGLAYRVWISNMNLMNFLIRQQTSVQAPILNYGWVQTPVKFEDACGRILPIPSEYNWGKVHAIIMDQFRSGPGHDKVSFGEYDLYDATNRNRKITSSEHETLMPGTSIIMAMRVGMHQFGLRTCCPNPGCRSNSISTSREGGRRCAACQVWHLVTREAPTQPFRTLTNKYSELKRDHSDKTASQNLQDVFKQIRLERMSFKNVQIHLHDPPAVQAILDDVQAASLHNSQRWAKNEDECSKSSIKSEMPSKSTPSSSSPSSTSALSSSSVSTKKVSISKLVLGHFAECLELDVSELSPTTRFEEIGLDSLVALSVTSQLHDEGLQLPESIFSDYPTVQELEMFLDGV